ncbi:MAG: Fe-S cluster assembly ATPase SufC [Candidatus Aenigmarchaeota archaeon]|nr:Fe-S cluster assembly ATPase SufC [Candidatus Aenigmarchaeota archaeon]
MTKLQIKDLHVSVKGKQIVKGLNLTINQGEIHALMGPNGSGKSTLAQAIMGHPNYNIDSGDILIDGESIINLPVDKRAKKGLFLSFQYPAEVPGVSMMNFFRMAMNALNGAPKTIPEFRQIVKQKMEVLKVDESFAKRYLNEGFSGGEKKKSEILQMALLNPKIAILDETDSGLDIDALKTVSEGISSLAGPETGLLLITHYNRMLKYITPHFVHILVDGRIVKSGDSSLAMQLDEKGYENIIKEMTVSS